MPGQERLAQLAEEVKLSQREVERWWRQQLAFTQPTKLTKFKEAMWRCLYYTSTSVAGLYVLWDKPWFTDPEQCWQPCGVAHNTSDVVFMYWIQLGMYVSLLVTQFQDIKRKDFVEVSCNLQGCCPLLNSRYHRAVEPGPRNLSRLLVKVENKSFMVDLMRLPDCPHCITLTIYT